MRSDLMENTGVNVKSLLPLWLVTLCVVLDDICDWLELTGKPRSSELVAPTTLEKPRGLVKPSASMCHSKPKPRWHRGGKQMVFLGKTGPVW